MCEKKEKDLNHILKLCHKNSKYTKMRNFIFFIICGLVLFNLTSCKLRYKEGLHPVDFEKTISGALSQSFIVKEAKLYISKQKWQSKVIVQVERTSSNLPDTDELKIYVDVLGKNEIPFEQLILMTGISNQGKNLKFADLYSLKTGEEMSLEFRIEVLSSSELNVKPKLAKKVKLHSLYNFNSNKK